MRDYHLPEHSGKKLSPITAKENIKANGNRHRKDSVLCPQEYDMISNTCISVFKFSSRWKKGDNLLSKVSAYHIW
jgi:hypothetical protein